MTFSTQVQYKLCGLGCCFHFCCFRLPLRYVTVAPTNLFLSFFYFSSSGFSSWGVFLCFVVLHSFVPNSENYLCKEMGELWENKYESVL